MATVTKSRGSTRNVVYRITDRSRTTYSTSRPDKLERPVPTVSRNYRRSDLESMTGVTSPGYFKAKREGKQLPVNPYTCSRHSYSESVGGFAAYQCLKSKTGSARYLESWYVATGFPIAQPLTGIPYPPVPNANSALTKAIANLRGDLWDIGTAAAEFGKTVRMIVNVATSLRRAQNLVLQAMGARRRGSNLSPREFLDEFSRLWLEGRYGWRPLYYDMLAAQEAYERLGGSLVVKRGASKLENSLESTAVSTLPGPVQIRRTTIAKRTARGFCGGQLDLSRPVSIDPLVTGWEVIPYSFVIDWFVNIGTNVQAYSPFAAGEILWSGVTESRTSESVFSIEFKPVNLADWEIVERSIEGSPMLFTAFKGVDRRALAGSLSLSFIPRMNILKGVDLAALALSLVSNVSSRAHRVRR